MNRDELEAMTKVELKEHAEAMGVSLLALDSKGTMVDKILGDHVPEKKKQADIPMPKEGRLYTLQGEPVSGKKYRVMIFATEQDKSDVPLIVNGHNVKIQRGKEVILDEAYVDILRNAVINTVVQDPDTGVKQPRMMMVYPHSAVEILPAIRQAAVRDSGV